MMSWLALLRKICLIGVIILLGWISFVAEPVQSHNSNVTKWALATLLFCSLISNKPSWKELFFKREDILLWFYLLAISYEVFFLGSFKETFHWYCKFILPIPLVYFLIKSEFTKANREILVRCLCFFSIIVAFIGYLELISRQNLIYKYLIENPYYYRFIYLQRRIMSTLLHPAVLGSYLIACLPLSFFLVSTGKTKFIRVIGLFSASLCVLGTIFTFSRGSLLGMVVLSCVYFWNKNKKLFFIFTAVTLIVIVSLCSISDRNTVVPGQRFSWKGLTMPNTYAYKIERAYVTKRMLQDRPVFGLGLDQFRPNFNKYYQKLFSKEAPLEFMVADNMYLMLLAETGIAGFAGFILFILFFLRKGLRSLKLINDPGSKDLLIALIAGMTGLMVNMLTYDLFYWTAPLFLFWVFIGMAAGILSRETTQILEAKAD